MRRSIGSMIAICLTTLLVADQGKPPAARAKQVQERQAEQAKEILTELQKHVYRARRDIRAVDCIVVQDGRIVEWHVHGRSAKKRALVLRAGAVTQVSAVTVIDSAIQVFFATDNCSLIAVSSVPLDTASMTIPQLLATARKAIEALFEPIGSVPNRPTNPQATEERKDRKSAVESK